MQQMIQMGQAPQGGNGQQAGGMLGMFAPMVVIFAIFYFLLIRPQKKQQKKTQELLSNLKRGDNVVTRGGIHGTIDGIADNIVTLTIAKDCKIKMNREAVSQLLQQPTTGAN